MSKPSREANTHSAKDAFDLTDRVAIITGGAGLLGVKHAEAIAEMGGIPVLIDVDELRAEASAKRIAATYDRQALGIAVNITDPNEIATALARVLETFGRVDILINNAANNPKIEDKARASHWSRLENFPLEIWNDDIAVGLTGAFLCSQIIGAELARRGSGVILNVASDLALIGPDQRIYRESHLPDEQQFVKPVTYSVVKSALLGLTRYLATYWADKGVRVNAISPGGVQNQQDDAFVQRLTNLIPLGRMARADEYKAAIIFLVSNASSYMTGANLIVDGGRTAW
jgi:NAD(P)-dependent dehydrogenase (short-subunit alcohol dehydrogenase family)